MATASSSPQIQRRSISCINTRDQRFALIIDSRPQVRSRSTTYGLSRYPVISYLHSPEIGTYMVPSGGTMKRKEKVENDSVVMRAKRVDQFRVGQRH